MIDAILLNILFLFLFLFLQEIMGGCCCKERYKEDIDFTSGKYIMVDDMI